MGSLCSPARAVDGYVALALTGPAGSLQSMVTGINNQGQLVGSSGYRVGNVGFTHATVWTGGGAVDLGSLGGNSHGLGINDAGQVVGYSARSPSSTDPVTVPATVWSGGSITALSSLGGGASMAYAMNASGRVVGSAYTRNNDRSHAASWVGGVITDLGTLGGAYSEAIDINSQGLVVGRAQVTGNTYEHAALWRNGSVVDLGSLISPLTSFALGINDGGQVVGWANMATGGTSAWLWDGAVATVLPDAGTNSRAYDINNTGAVVGLSEFAFGEGSVATLWTQGQRINLNAYLSAADRAQGWVLDAGQRGYEMAINDQGWISVTATNTNTGLYRPYLLMPSAVPEPSTWLMMMLGGVLLLAVQGRRDGVSTGDQAPASGL